MNDLMLITSFNPCLAHFLISLSEIAMVKSIVGRFSGSKPSERCSPRVVNQSETEFRHDIEEIDRAMINNYSQRLKKPTLSTILRGDFTCSYLSAQHLREDLRGIKMTGVTMPAAHEQCALIRYSDMLSVLDTLMVIIKPHSNPNIIRGPAHPYIGSKTAMQTKKSSLEVITKDDMVTSLLQLLELLPWCYQGYELLPLRL